MRLHCYCSVTLFPIFIFTLSGVSLLLSIKNFLQRPVSFLSPLLHRVLVIFLHFEFECCFSKCCFVATLATYKTLLLSMYMMVYTSFVLRTTLKRISNTKLILRNCSRYSSCLVLASFEKVHDDVYLNHL